MTFEPHEKNVELSSKLLFVSFFHLPTGSLGCLSSFSRSVQFPALRILHSHVSSIIHQNEGRNFQKKATRIRHMMFKWCSFHKLLYISTVPVFIKCALSAAQNLLLQFNNCTYALNRRMTSNELLQVECVLHLTYHTSHMLNCTVAGGWTHSKDSNQAKPMSCMKIPIKKSLLLPLVFCFSSCSFARLSFYLELYSIDVCVVSVDRCFSFQICT